MKVEVLVATVNCTDVKKLIKKMNIQTDAIIANQCDHIGYEEIKYNNSSIKVYSFPERGVGLNRNNALMRASGDIVLFADDDEVLVDGYEKKVINEFETNEKADFIAFNIESYGNNKRKCKQIIKEKKIHWYNCLRYGAVRFAVKLESIRKNNIYFSLLFGGGTRYSCGEDSIFIYDCIKSGMVVYQNKTVIAKVNMTKSSWFNGYDKKYYFDKGALFAAMNSKFNFIYLLIIILKNNKIDKNNSLSWKFKTAIKGYKEFKIK